MIRQLRVEILPLFDVFLVVLLLELLHFDGLQREILVFKTRTLFTSIAKDYLAKGVAA